MKIKKILKSTNPSLYPDLEVECKVIKNEDITTYIDNIPTERKFVAYKTGVVSARYGIPGEEIKTVLKTIIDGKEYILFEESNTVKERVIDEKTGERKSDIVVKNISSTSDEEYVVKYTKFITTYNFDEDNQVFIPAYEPREFAQVSENIIFETTWGTKVTCLKGSYIVTYNALENDYNSVEQGAFTSTYTKNEILTKKLKRN